MLPIEVTDSGVVIIRLRADLDIVGRAAAAAAIDGHLAAHRTAPVVLELTHAPISPAALSTVVRAHHMCRQAGRPMAVVAADLEVRRTLEAHAVTEAPAIHGSRERALSDLQAPLAAAA
ncbi:STAS domain-containing protein [Streptomyces sp. NPDC048507]|uniref:STAS domain-containing protein n=1 Tax=Streptomyces sp. NPDC048507 TaxID=3365560 RepID=UPI00371E550E